MHLLQNIVLGLSLAAPLGPVNVEIIRRGLKHGFPEAFLTGLGAVCADFTYLLLIFFGMTPLLQFKIVRLVLFLIGGTFLIIMGVLSMIEAIRMKSGKDDKKRRRLGPYPAGYILAISSPLTIVWWIGVFGAVLASSPDRTLAALIPNISVLLGCLLWVLVFSLILHFGRKRIGPKTLYAITFSAGLALAVFGGIFIGKGILFLIQIIG